MPVHAGRADALDEPAVLELLVVLEVFDAGVDELEHGQHPGLLFLLLLLFGLEAVGPLQDGEVAPLFFPSFGDGQVFLLEVEQQLVFPEVFAGGGGETLGFVVPVLVGSGDVYDAGDAGVAGLVEDHFQLDHLGVLRVFAALECDRTVHIVNFWWLMYSCRFPTWEPT